MADARSIIRSSGTRGAAGGLAAGLDAVPVAVAVASYGTTDRITIDTGGSNLPLAILGANPNRKSAVVYNPTSAPDTAAAGALVWIGYDLSRPGTFFPLEAGGQFVHESKDWLYAWTESGSPSRVFVAEELY